jgi:hypothetical protein
MVVDDRLDAAAVMLERSLFVQVRNEDKQNGSEMIGPGSKNLSAVSVDFAGITESLTKTPN